MCHKFKEVKSFIAENKRRLMVETVSLLSYKNDDQIYFYEVGSAIPKQTWILVRDYCLHL